jgi:hypothetical protein
MKTINKILEMKSGLFVIPDSTDDALARVQDIARGSNDPASVYMAVQILINGIAKELENEK